MLNQGLFGKLQRHALNLAMSHSRGPPHQAFLLKKMPRGWLKDVNEDVNDNEDVKIEPPADPPGPDQPTINQHTSSSAIDRNEDILKISPDIEIDIADDEPTIEPTMRF